jgi:hypothetical protein
LISSKLLAEIVVAIEEHSADDLKGYKKNSCLVILGSKLNLQDTLDSVDLSLHRAGGSRSLAYPKHFLKPLGRLKCLKRLRIRGEILHPMQFVDDAILRLRELEELTVPMDGEGGINIQSLHSIAASCPRLLRLSMPIDTSPGNIPELPWNVTIVNHGLRELRTNEGSRWKMPEHLLAARHINALFSNLEVLEGGEGWKAVRTIVQMIRDVARRQG